MTTVPTADVTDQIARHRIWFIVLGIALVLAGLFAIAFPLAGGLIFERWVAIAFVPYLIWVGIATALQFSITWLNR